MSLPVNGTTDNIDVKKITSPQPVGPRQVPLREENAFKAFFNKDREAPNKSAHQKSAGKKENDAPMKEMPVLAMPLGMFGTPSITDNTWDISGASTADPIKAALGAMSELTYAGVGAQYAQTERADGSLHVRVLNTEFANVEIVVSMAVSQEEKKRVGNQIHMQILSTTPAQREAFLNASAKLQKEGTTFSGCSLHINVSEVKPAR